MFMLSRARRLCPRVDLKSTLVARSLARCNVSTNVDKLVPEEAKLALLSAGCETTSLWEQPVVWGDLDSFQHVNNVHYVRYFESGRIKWLSSLANDLGGPEKVRSMLAGKDVSVILKSIQVKYRRPVTFPDTLLIGHKAYPIRPSSTEFGLRAAAYSYEQRAIVAECDCIMVWYDYRILKKCIPGAKEWDVLSRRMEDNELK